LWAGATGYTNPFHTDEVAGRAAGFRDLPAPPTFLISAEYDSPAAQARLAQMGVALPSVLHGGQAFRHFAPVCAGDVVRCTTRVQGVEAKKGGALVLLTFVTEFDAPDGLRLAEARMTLAIRPALAGAGA
ncbi:MAG: MaoC family dehydratase N-terminal domain-containing protein, partial [Rhodobacteraceae bacterium]|nr:MaoC family dehydratase N-terminal domain-containing protein [Paracoccaceae bacterium]